MIKFEYISVDKLCSANEDIFKLILNKNPKATKPLIKKMSLSCDKDFTANINGEEITIKKDFGFEMGYDDPIIKSFKILTDAVTIYALIAYSVEKGVR